MYGCELIMLQHFVGGNGPTDAYPDPFPADGSNVTQARPLPKRRRMELAIADDVVDGVLENITYQSKQE